MRVSWPCAPQTHSCVGFGEHLPDLSKHFHANVSVKTHTHTDSGGYWMEPPPRNPVFPSWRVCFRGGGAQAGAGRARSGVTGPTRTLVNCPCPEHGTGSSTQDPGRLNPLPPPGLSCGGQLSPPPHPGGLQAGDTWRNEGTAPDVGSFQDPQGSQGCRGRKMKRIKAQGQDSTPPGQRCGVPPRTALCRDHDGASGGMFVGLGGSLSWAAGP